MSTITEVLSRHRWLPTMVGCTCDWEPSVPVSGSLVGDYAAARAQHDEHVAEQLAAAGFGPGVAPAADEARPKRWVSDREYVIDAPIPSDTRERVLAVLAEHRTWGISTAGTLVCGGARCTWEAERREHGGANHTAWHEHLVDELTVAAVLPSQGSCCSSCSEADRLAEQVRTLLDSIQQRRAETGPWDDDYVRLDGSLRALLVGHGGQAQPDVDTQPEGGERS